MNTLISWLSLGAKRPTRTAMPLMDVPLLTVIVLLALFGLLMVYSASIALPTAPLYKNYSQYHFVIRQTLFMVVGGLLAVALSTVPLRVWERLAVPLFIFAVVLLVVVLVPGIGRVVNGSRRWIPLGIVMFQPSEVMKLGIILFSSWYVVRKKEQLSEFIRGFLPMIGVLGGVGFLLMMEPDLGALMVVAIVAIAVLFMGGLAWRWIILMMGLLVGVGGSLIWFFPWRRARVFGYLNPWDSEHVLGSGYQLSHSLIAFGRGEWFGVGLGSSIEKLHYLPEAHTDFIMAVIGEELGLVGVSLVILAFVFLVWRAFAIGRQALVMERTFNAMMALGIGTWLGVQSFINIGVCLGVLPTKGLTLPLISYGGSGVIMNFIALALLLRIDYENRSLMRGKSP